MLWRAGDTLPYKGWHLVRFLKIEEPYLEGPSFRLKCLLQNEDFQILMQMFHFFLNAHFLFFIYSFFPIDTLQVSIGYHKTKIKIKIKLNRC